MFTSVYNILIVNSYFCNEIKALMLIIIYQNQKSQQNENFIFCVLYTRFCRSVLS